MNRLGALAFALLLAAASAQAEPRGAVSPEAAAGNPDKMICKRFLRTGSLADYYRTCKTKAEWERERENLRQDANRTASCRMNDAYAEPCK
jgi:hypothetical protein